MFLVFPIESYYKHSLDRPWPREIYPVFPVNTLNTINTQTTLFLDYKEKQSWRYLSNFATLANEMKSIYL